MDTLPQLRKAIAERYLIEEEIGRGGTATVYRARDLKHRRNIAVKVLHVEVAAAMGSERFLREIETAAQLTHPHILPLYDSGEADGLYYYTMPCIEGESLRARLEREGTLPVRLAVRIARQVAEGLAYAHSRGVVHRDIKPENILLLDGAHALIADFGLARALYSTTNRPLTAMGLVVGSPLYMSPEQICGDPGVDGRSDVYSLGCVLFEMLAGRPPFDGSTAQEVLGRHLTATAPSLCTLRPAVPAEVQEVVDRALAKVPADRFTDAAALAEALSALDARAEAGRTPTPALPAPSPPHPALRLRRAVALASATALLAAGVVLVPRPAARPTTPAPALPLHRVAVLYLDDHSPDQSLGYLANGLTEGLIDQLSRVDELEVVSRNGVRPYRGRGAALDSIARDLGAGSIVEGSVQRSANQLRVVAHLVDASTGTRVGSAHVERPAGELFALEDELAHEVARALRRQLGHRITLARRIAGTASAEARDLLLRATQRREDAATLAAAPDASAVPAAMRLLDEADSLAALAERHDPAWARVPVLRGWIAVSRAALASGQEEARHFAEAIRHAGRALTITPDLPEAYELRGTARWELSWTIDPGNGAAARELWTAAERDLRAAVAQNPKRTRAWTELSELLLYSGRFAEASFAAQQALAADAFLDDAPAVQERLFFTALFRGQYRAAERYCAEGAAQYSDDLRFVQCQLTVMRRDSQRPNPARAWQLVEKLDSIDPPEKTRAAGRAYLPIYRRMVYASVLAHAGETDSARAVVARAREAAAHDDGLRLSLLYDEAQVQLALGDREAAVQLLEKYLRARPMLRDFIRSDYSLRTLRSDVGFRAMAAWPTL